MSTYTPIATQTLSNPAASVTFSSIPQNYTDLIVVVNARGTSPQSMRLQFNNDTGSNYSGTQLYADIVPGTALSARESSATDIRVGWFANGLSTTDFTSCIIQMQNYSNNAINKTVLSRSAQAVNATVGLWRNTNAVTTISLFPFSGNFTSASTFNLYGIVEGGGYALGGDIVTTDGTYWYHTFLSSGAFIPTKDLTVDYLVVAGGGGGGGANSSVGTTGGGGGAGGMRCTVGGTGGSGGLETALTLSNGVNYPVIIGAGGTVDQSAAGVKGNNSVFATIVSAGGGGGGSFAEGIPGGSGGGGGGNKNTGATINGGTASPSGQGFAGGTGRYVAGTFRGAGGGGGASAVGGNGVSGTAGSGGAGRATSISGSSVTYAGGGGGSGDTSGAGGAGGGGKGSDGSLPAVNGTANTGGGGGGRYYNLGNAPGTGGSGIVIVRYAV
jgi:hypothetical protein